jgi:predicted nucleic acid-binding protein
MEPPRVSALIDTDVLIDILRGTPAAQAWLARSSATAFQIPGIVAMELLMGCRNQTELRRVQQFLGAFSVAWTEAPEFAQAYDLLATYRLRSGLSIPDCLMAAMALTRSATLYTFNMRHFRVITGLDVQEPYTRA